MLQVHFSKAVLSAGGGVRVELKVAASEEYSAICCSLLINTKFNPFTSGLQL